MVESWFMMRAVSVGMLTASLAAGRENAVFRATRTQSGLHHEWPRRTAHRDGSWHANRLEMEIRVRLDDA